MTEGPYTRVTWRGKKVNARTRDALKWSEKKWRKKYPSKRIELSQGSYSSSVPASGSTHKGGGVVDIRTRNLTSAQRVALVHALKDAGFAAWYRTEKQGFSPHIHACLIGDREMSSSAKGQCVAYDKGRDGLTGNRVDATYRAKPKVRFTYKRQKPVPR